MLTFISIIIAGIIGISTITLICCAILANRYDEAIEKDMEV